ncbi:MAG TPA: hypothetical protein VLD59_14445 [Steroidobacteraceae bacterium]|nr:hypothetical protein [Steroidobacteraceae bacterium]
MSLRDRVQNTAMNWIALGVLLGAWHMEARLDRTLGSMNAHVAKPPSGRGTQLWNGEPGGTSWISRAAAGAPLVGVRHVVPPASVYTPVSTLRLVRRWLPGV